jgi:hypothetical protein
MVEPQPSKLVIRVRFPSPALACAAVALAASLAGCGTHVAPSTSLTLLAVNPEVGRAAFHLTCGPSGGDFRDAAGACAALAERPDLVTKPKPFVCRGGTTSWWDVTISGRLRGHAVRAHTSTCWTPQMATIRRLGIGGWQSLRAHLLPRRREVLLPTERRAFASGALRPGDLVTCRIRGHKLEAGVPIAYGTGGVGWGGKDVVPVTLSITRKPDGSVTASCHTGPPS